MPTHTPAPPPSPLEHFCLTGNLDGIASIVRPGADVTRMPEVYPAMEKACASGNEACAIYMLECFDASKQCLLLGAAYNNYPHLVRTMLAHTKVPYNHIRGTFEYVMHHSIRYLDVLCAFIETGHVFDSDMWPQVVFSSSKRVIDAVIRAAHTFGSCEETMQVLRNISIDAFECMGWVEIHMDLLEALIEDVLHGDVDTRHACTGLTPMLVSCFFGRDTNVRMLIEKGYRLHTLHTPLDVINCLTPEKLLHIPLEFNMAEMCFTVSDTKCGESLLKAGSRIWCPEAVHAAAINTHIPYYIFRKVRRAYIGLQIVPWLGVYNTRKRKALVREAWRTVHRRIACEHTIDWWCHATYMPGSRVAARVVERLATMAVA